MTRVWKKVVARRAWLSETGERQALKTCHFQESLPLLENHPFRICICIYESPMTAPRMERVEGNGIAEFLDVVTPRVYDMALAMGGILPRAAFKELLDNFIHSGLRDPLVSILDNGNTLTVSDNGPGIEHPEKAMQPGYTTATDFIRRYIRGVGSGFPLVQEMMTKMGGTLTIDRNLSGGTLVKASINHSAAMIVRRELSSPTDQRAFRYSEQSSYRLMPGSGTGLSDREKHVLLLLAEVDTVGPSQVSKELDISLSTAHRDLAKLERRSFLCSLPNGKKRLTKEGMGQLELIFAGAESAPPGKKPQSSED